MFAFFTTVLFRPDQDIRVRFSALCSFLVLWGEIDFLTLVAWLLLGRILVGQTGRGARGNLSLTSFVLLGRWRPLLLRPPQLGKGGPPHGCVLQAESRCQMAALDPCKRTPGRVLLMGSTARDVCVSAGKRKLLLQEGAEI